METFLFGPDETLFGAYWEGEPEPNAPAVLVCNGYGQDAVRSNLVLRHTARLLSEAGCPALLFDYHGTGDSADQATGVDLDSMNADALIAKQELIDISGRSKVVALGVRLGAWIAAHHADRVVLWSPVIDGASHLSELRRLHDAMLTDSVRFPIPRQADVDDAQGQQLLGFAHSERWCQQVAALNWAELLKQRSFQKIGLLQHQAHAAALAADSDCRVAFERPDEHWDTLVALEIALTSSPALSQLAEAVARW